MLLVDRLITESTLEAAIESRNRMMQATTSATDNKEDHRKVSFRDVSSPGKLVECKICLDEDEDSNMETPCSCCGSLKYAHRRCVQRWCNEKGDTTCEICHQQFKPGYTAPPPLFQFDRVPLNFRGNWEISRSDLNSQHFITMVSTDRNFLDSDYERYSDSAPRNLLCCRSVVLIFMVLLVLRHTLPLILSGNNDYSFPLVMLLILRTIGIVLPIYVVAKALAATLTKRRNPPDTAYSLSESSDEETEDSIVQPEPHVIHVH